MDNISLQRVNKAFWAMAKTAAGRDELIETTDLYLRQKIREDAFWRSILPPKIVDPVQCTRSIHHDGLVKIIDIEPDSFGAVAIDWRGESEHRYIKGPRYEVPFYKIDTPILELKEADEFVYEMPITEIIRYQTEKDIADREDAQFINAADAALTHSGKVVSSANASFTKKDLIPLFNQLDGDKNRTAVILMNLVQYNNILAWEHAELGDPLLSSVTVEGFSTAKILGKTLIITNKSEIIPVNSIYSFSIPNFLGHAFLLSEDLKFDMESEFDVLKFKSWEYIAAAIGNIKSVAKLELDVPADVPEEPPLAP